jgi:hypothetical protein
MVNTAELRATLQGNLVQAAIAFDCGCNVVVCTLTLQKAYAGETLSAHAWRARDKIVGRIFRPFVDLLFRWQKPEPEYAVDGAAVRSHCQRAFMKLQRLAYLPQEYRAHAPA